jgi:hypothetical protein
VEEKRVTRRDFMRGAILTGAGLLLGNSLRSCPGVTDSVAQGVTPSPHTYLPLVLKQSTPTPTPTSTPTSTPTPTPTTEPGPTSIPGTPKVVHVHNTSATDWNDSGWYGDAVDQGVVNSMAQSGLQELTGRSSWSEIWYELFKRVNPSGYQPGQGIAIKVNFNNAWNCAESDNEIDALPHPVKALIAGLTQAGVRQEDILVYDAIRNIPDRFRDPILAAYPNVRFYGAGCSGVQQATFDSSAPNATVTFSPPQGIPAPSSQKVTDVLVDADYLIDMPILKNHDCPGVSLSFKNHFGTIADPGSLHDYVCLYGSHFSNSYNPLVDIYKNSNVVGKTILIVGDGLFGSNNGHTSPPMLWTTFSSQFPNSLFFATDVVAVDCVMCDLLHAEITIPVETDYYLQLAADAGLGVFERGDPWGSGYGQIDYVRIG